MIVDAKNTAFHTRHGAPPNAVCIGKIDFIRKAADSNLFSITRPVLLRPLQLGEIAVAPFWPSEESRWNVDICVLPTNCRWSDSLAIWSGRSTGHVGLDS